MIQTDLTPGILVCRHPATSKKQLLESLCSRLARHASLCERTVLDAVLEREKLGSTAIGDGIALPHATIAGASATSSLLATLDQPVDFDSPDGRHVDIVMLILGCGQHGTEHLSSLSVAARQIRYASELLRHAGDESELRVAVAGLVAAA